MIIAPNGTSMLAAGLDHWYERDDGTGDSRDLDLAEFRVEEWRLERLLRVNHFQEPPDYRVPAPGQRIPNVKLSVPFLRFPLWHFCWRCNHLHDLELVTKGRQPCPYCAAQGKRALLAQVPFVAMCETGHLQDFPWREWVHRTANPSCDRPMTLKSTGGATLANQVVRCECGVAPRTLSGVVEASSDGSTYLTNNLEAGTPYLCRGISPQHGSTEASRCGQQIKGSLRSASNVYFARVFSAIYLPRSTGTVSEQLLSALEIPPLSTVVHMSIQLGQPATPEQLRSTSRELLHPYSDAELQEAVRLLASEMREEEEQPALSPEEPDQVAFRREEHDVLKTQRREDQLTVSTGRLSDYDDRIRPFIERIMLVDRLRETRVLTGFNRIYPEQPLSSDAGLAQLWQNVPDWRNRWLPAYKVYGEGILIELDANRIAEWSAGPAAERAAAVERRYGAARQARHLSPRTVTPAFLLVHTFAHLLINQLTFECGYSTAALRERLYVSDSPDAPMAGVLIYTAAGDAEGTMGGLVRMGKPGYLEPAILAALRSALWCSADPVCMEIGTQSGQGPDSCNLAACHNCCLVPETACEEFNRFLDRAVVVGSVENRGMGFFDGIL